MQEFDDSGSNASSRRSRASAIGAESANSSKQLSFPEPTLTKILNNRFPLFPMMLTYKQANMQIVSLISMAIFMMQHWAFFLNPWFSVAWGGVLGSDLSKLCYGFQLALYDPTMVSSASPAMYIGFAYALLAVVFLLLFCILFHLRPMEDRSEGKGPSNTVGRIMLDVLSSILVIPIYQFCFAAMVCGSTGRMWMLPYNTAAKCWGPSHVASFVPAIIVMLVLLPLLYAKIVCVYDYIALSDNFLAKRHSLVDKLTYLHDAFSCFLFSIMLAWNVPVGFVVIHAITSAILVLSYIYFLPYFTMKVNRFYVLVHTVECIGSIFVAASLSNYTFSTSEVSSLLLLGAGVVVTFMMVVITDYRVNTSYIYAMKRSQQCSHFAFDGTNETEDNDDHHARLFEDNVCHVDDTEVGMLPYPKGLIATNLFCQYAGLNKQVAESITRQELNSLLSGGQGAEKKKTLPVLEAYLDRVFVNLDVTLSTGFLDLYTRRFSADQISEMMLMFAANIYSKGLVTFPDEPNILQGFATLITTYLPGMSFMGVDLVKRSLRLPTSVEQQFRALKQEGELRAALGIRTHAHSIRSTKARTTHGRVLQSINKFWMKLTEPNVNIKEVSDIADDIRVRRELAISQFDLALRHQQSADAVLLRRLGDFFTEVMMAPDAAHECYNESRDVYEARQARSMRGTRQHVGDIDVVALSERMRQLLQYHKKGGSRAGTGTTSMMRRFCMLVTTYFVVLVACSAMFIYVVNAVTKGLDDIMQGTMACTSLRSEACRFASTAIGYTIEGNSGTKAIMLTLMESQVVSFSKNFKFVSSGRGQPHSKEGKYLMSENNIPFYDITTQNSRGFSLWSFTETFIQAMSGFLHPENSVSHVSDTTFIMDAGAVVGQSYSNLLSLHTTKELAQISVAWIGWLVGIFMLALICICITYTSLLFAFRRIAISRVFTFQLFTLIPYDVLEKLATEAKERYHYIHLEKSYKRPVQTIMDGAGDGGGGATKQEVVEMRVKHGVVTHAPNITLGNVESKSCLKPQPGAVLSSPESALKRRKRVTFNPVVEVVGGGGPETKKKNEEESAKEVESEDEEGTDLLLLSGVSRKKAATGTSASSTGNRAALCGTLLYFFVMVCCLVVVCVTIVLFMVTQSGHSEVIDTYSVTQRELVSQCLSITEIVHSTIRFVQTGAAVDFQNTQDTVSRLVQSLPNRMGIQFTTESTRKLVRMHQLSRMIGNLTLDASALAAKFHDTSLMYWSDIRDRVSMDEEELYDYMKAKYPTSAAISNSIVAYFQNQMSPVQLMAFVTVVSNTVTYSREFRSLYFEVMQALSLNDGARVVVSDTYWIITLATSSIAVAISLVFALSPLRDVVAKYLSWKQTMGTALAFSVMLVMSVLMMIAARRVKKDSVSPETGFTTLNSFVDRFMFMDESFSNFVFTAQPQPWFDGANVNVHEVSNMLGSNIESEYLEEGVTTLFAVMTDEWNRIAQLCNISCALAINSLSNYFVVEAPMQEALDLSYWDITLEPGYLENQVLNPEIYYYTSKTEDLTWPTVVQYNKATTILAGSEYMQSTRLISDSILSLYDYFVLGEVAETQQMTTFRANIAIIFLSLCVFPIAACLWMGGTAMNAIQEVLQLNSDSGNQNTSSDTARYNSMLRRVQCGLLLLALLFSATFGVGIWLTQTGFSFIGQLNLATQHEYHVAISFYRFRQLLSTRVFFTSPSSIVGILTQLSDQIIDQFRGTVETGVPRGLSLSDTVNELVFGIANIPVQREVMISYLMNNCSDFCRGPYSPLPLVDATVANNGEISSTTETVAAGAFNWIDLVRRGVAVAEDFSDSSTNTMETTLNTLTEIALPIMTSLSDSSYAVLSALDDHRKILTNVFLVLSIFTLLACLFVYVLVIIPTVMRLFKEEEASRVLLQMIPPDVRDEVPAIAQYAETGEMSNAAELHSKFEANEKLLQNILPQKIAVRLKSGERPIADPHKCVTMLFTDFVGFTKRSSTMQAREIVDFLNEVFLEFDTVVELLGVEKIKTIGDAFFMAGGLDPLVTDHALRVVEAGLMFFEALEEHNRRHPNRVPLQMRLGVHSGPVVAGVIGIKKVQYDLWGDSVEIANAMESTGVPGFVHVSENTAVFVRGYFQLEPRGELPREKEHIPDNMPPTFNVVSRILPTPYMHLRRPRLLPTNIRQMQ